MRRRGGAMNCSVIIAAAGQGKRMQSDINKQYIRLKEKPILAHTIEAFEKVEEINEIILVVSKNEIDLCSQLVVKPYGFKKVKKIIGGGKERQDSIYEGLQVLSKETDVVLIHDGARPFIKEKEIKKSIQVAHQEGACVVGVRVKDTIKLVNKEQCILQTPDRSQLWSVQTPQVFQYKILKRAYEKAKEDHFMGTDDASVVERLGIPVKIIEGQYSNIKITTPEDLVYGEIILA